MLHNGSGIAAVGDLKTVRPNLALKFNSSTTVQLLPSAPIAAIPCYRLGFCPSEVMLSNFSRKLVYENCLICIKVSQSNWQHSPQLPANRLVRKCNGFSPKIFCSQQCCFCLCMLSQFFWSELAE